MKKGSFAIVLMLLVFFGALNLVPKVGDYYSGVYVNGFETSAFRPEGINEDWWVDAPDEFYNAYRDLTKGEEYKKVKVDIKADVSATGMYGHLGEYDREAKVREFKNMKLAE